MFQKKLTPEQRAQLPEVVVYTTPTCVYCHALMDWLEGLGVPYTEKSAVGEPGISAVPVTKIAGETIVGFDRPAIKKALGL